MIKQLLLGLTFFSMILVFSSQAGYAQLFDNACSGGKTDQSTVCQQKGDRPNSANNSFYGSNGVITKAVNIISILAAVAAVIIIIIAGIQYIMSGGDSAKINTAKNAILYSIIGLLIVAFAQVIVRFVLIKLAD